VKALVEVKILFYFSFFLGYNGKGDRIVSGPHYKVPTNGGSLTYAVRQVMEKIGVADKMKGAKETGLSQDTYIFIRKMIILAEDERVPSDRRMILRRTLRKIDEDRNIPEAHTIADYIVNEYWARHTIGGSTHKDRYSHHRQKQILENVLFAIREACTNNEDIPIPPLTQDERAHAIEFLATSIASLSAMLHRVNYHLPRREKDKADDKGHGLQDPGHPGEEPVGGLGEVTASVQQGSR
jgi:hypothetical protein